MICTPDQIKDILLNNPNKALIQEAKNKSDKLMMHVLGKGIGNSLQKSAHFESNEIFTSRQNDVISNRDVFARLLQREDMVFTAKGGAALYSGLSLDETSKMDGFLSQIRYQMSVRKWVKEFALKAYRTDPMSLIFMEVDNKGNVYPTYKSIACIYDYVTTGRKVEYVALRLTPSECKQFGVKEVLATNQTYAPNYFRFVDDAQDTIFKIDGTSVTAFDTMPTMWDEVAAIITSDLIDFDNPAKFVSPLTDTIELADSFLRDRSVRDLSKKYSGFPKTIEPLLSCGICLGTGILNGLACPECTPAGADRGTGYKLSTKVADVARFPIDKDIDVHKLYAYITPDITTWDKQDTSLVDIENLIRDVYWGSYSRQSTTGPTAGQTGLEETATKTIADLQPIYARLNMTADWAESTENAICNFVGRLLFPSSFKQSIRTYGRYYILETPDDLMEDYLAMKGKGASQYALTESLKRYYHSLHQNNSMKLAIALKMMNVEPFVHSTIAQVQASNPAKVDFVAKVYFSEWLAMLTNEYIIATKEDALIKSLSDYVDAKILLAPELIIEPGVSITESLKTSN